jgi:hypothetical protein
MNYTVILNEALGALPHGQSEESIFGFHPIFVELHTRLFALLRVTYGKFPKRIFSVTLAHHPSEATRGEATSGEDPRVGGWDLIRQKL